MANRNFEDPRWMITGKFAQATSHSASSGTIGYAKAAGNPDAKLAFRAARSL